MTIETRFGSRNAAEVWDAEFRWREAGRLRDVTVDDTWNRVADALAAAGGGMDAAARARTYAQRFARWRLLPSAALLATAGTGAPLQRLEEPHVVLNCAAFAAEGGADAGIDWGAFEDAARLAVWLLDDAALAIGGRCPGAWVGLIGLGTALVRRGIGYDTAPARELAMRFARCLGVAIAEASILLAIERGARGGVARDTLECWRTRGVTPEWLVAAEQQGVRNVVACRVARVPTLARLAGTSDALDPAPCERTHDPASAVAAMRSAVQPWVDAPIAA